MHRKSPYAACIHGDPGCRSCHLKARYAVDEAYRSQKKARVKKWRKENTPENREARRAWYAARGYAHRYNVSAEYIADVHASQGGACAICGQVTGYTGKGRLNVDHEHSSGRVRGLLCFNCNVGIGKFKDDVQLLARAAEYLLSPPAYQVPVRRPPRRRKALQES